MVHKAQYDRFMVSIWDNAREEIIARNFYPGFHEAHEYFRKACQAFGHGYIVALRPSDGVKHGDSIRIRWGDGDLEIKGTI